ncbi:MAG: hypothetical protein MZW92_01810 [Comamonadaceae bacterium]|nr:hypothetical protein [Comamonadaceae bacterium]
MLDHQPLGVAALAAGPGVAARHQNLGAFRIDHALAAAVVEQERAVALARIVMDPLIVVAAFDPIAIPKTGQSGQRRAQRQTTERTAAALQFHIALGGGSHPRGRRIRDHAGVSHRRHPGDEAEGRHQPGTCQYAGAGAVVECEADQEELRRRGWRARA